jgi:hypothetical protein
MLVVMESIVSETRLESLSDTSHLGRVYYVTLRSRQCGLLLYVFRSMAPELKMVSQEPRRFLAMSYSG